MSRASKRAKERQNRSLDELVMAETKISRSQFLQVADVRKWTDVRSGRKSADSAPVMGFRLSGKVRRPVVPAARTSGKVMVVRCIGVNFRSEIRDAILSGIWGFWGQN